VGREEGKRTAEKRSAALPEEGFPALIEPVSGVHGPLHAVRRFRLPMAVIFAACAGAILSGSEAETIGELQRQNAELRDQVARQQQTIDRLSSRLDALAAATERNEQALNEIRGGGPLPERLPEPDQSALGGTVRVSGVAGAAMLDTGPKGQWPNSEFRIDDAKLLLEASVWRNAYLVAGLDLVTREANDEYFHVGELFAEWENVSGLWGRDGLLSLRAGRVAIPFGEEYAERGIMENPLISHSVSDIWGIDEGIEAFGTLGPAEYVLAVQNGGHKTLHDFDSDKSVAGRISFEPFSGFRVSASGMRTGDLNSANDGFSELWIGGGFFRSIGSPATTRLFRANLGEIDLSANWTGGRFRGTLGQARYDDDDSTADNSRRLRYYSAEAMQRVFRESLYAAARYSRIQASRGYPIVGEGAFGDYFFASPHTRLLERLSLGLGYRFSPSFLLKSEYNLERRTPITGNKPPREHLIATEVGVSF